MLNDRINEFKQNIYDTYENTCKKISENIYKGHLRAMSTDVEDQLTLFLSKLLPCQYKFFIDAQINVNKKNHRPDLLIINENNEVVAMIEIKANMGYCRNANIVIDKMIEYNEEFKNSKLNCNLKVNEEQQTVYYGNNVKLFLISFLYGNCPPKNHEKNKIYANDKNVYYYNLFRGWYGDLENFEIEDFSQNIILKV